MPAYCLPLKHMPLLKDNWILYDCVLQRASIDINFCIILKAVHLVSPVLYIGKNTTVFTLRYIYVGSVVNSTNSVAFCNCYMNSDVFAMIVKYSSIVTYIIHFAACTLSAIITLITVILNMLTLLTFRRTPRLYTEQYSINIKTLRVL